MGSGLILLVIVGAWLAVLVPMALRSSDGGTAARTADRFGDAMRVLSPRSSRRGPEEPGGMEPLLHSVRLAPRPPLSLVARRRRVLLTLVGSTVLFLLGGALSAWLLGLGVVLLALTVAYVVHLRRLALAREERALREDWHGFDDGADEHWDAEDAPQVSYDARAWDVLPWEAPEVEGVPDRMPPREVARYEAERYEAVRRAGLPAAVGSEWSAVPVPPPLYVGQPVAPPRPPRTVDLSMGGAYATVSAEELGAEPDLELDQILEGRRAVGGW